MELIDREDHQKLYMQLYEILKKKIEINEWPVGTQIPTEEELCTIYSVSRATVRTAILELVRQGYLKRQQGKGTFIFRNVVTEGLSMLTSVHEPMVEAEQDLSSVVLAKTVMMPVDDLNIKLGIQEDKHIIYIKRIWKNNNKPVLFQEAYIPYHICPLLIEEDIEHHSLFDLFEKNYGIKITKIRNHLEVIHLTAEESRLLDLSEGFAAIVLTQHFFSGDTQIMFSRSVNGSDKFRFFMDFERKAA